jgi:hypothetical protein
MAILILVQAPASFSKKMRPPMPPMTIPAPTLFQNDAAKAGASRIRSGAGGKKSNAAQRSYRAFADCPTVRLIQSDVRNALVIDASSRGAIDN